MIVDTSVVTAILYDEDDAHVYAKSIANAPAVFMSAASYLELGIVIDRQRNRALSEKVDAFLSSAEIEILPVTETQARLAREAHQRFGRGSGHPAKLNFGDCFSYALAKDTGQPLLFKGNDFAATDGIRLADLAV